MGNGRLTEMQLDVLRDVVRGRSVHDLGAGDCGLSWMLLRSGAAKVIAVDQVRWPSWGDVPKPPPHLEFVEMSFDECALSGRYPLLDVAFVSWPVNRREHGLVALLRRARTIVYLGSNTDCNACGGPDLLGYFLMRKVERYVAARTNTLIVLGAPLSESRAATGEEAAGLSQWVGAEVVRFEEAILNVPACGVVDRSHG